MFKINRRAFLISATLAGAGALLEAGRIGQSAATRTEIRTAMTAPWSPSTDLHARPAPIAVVQGPAYADLVRQAVHEAGGVAALVGRAERVVIKPTLAWNRTPAQGANVHPDVLRAVVELVLEGGAQEVLIFDRTALPAATAYRVSGARRAILGLDDSRVRLVALTEQDFVPLPTRTAHLEQVPMEETVQATYICRHILEADRIINIATAKVHPTRRVSLALANLLGLVGGGPADAAWLQHKDVELALLYAAIRPDFTILDATRSVVRNGPMGRGVQDVERWDTIVASRDGLAVEAYGATRFNIPPAALRYLALAQEVGAGVAAHAPDRIVEG